ncbi:hypothetical protein R3P38DRAFT_2570469 [Favolaschia claudopus]|uniref:CxC2-like cysteine cluster KDZ transposase-associated domain-containing protein n=1 Tax=Favolaschia claudopus TaxID=2862362 RepID=A0AAV9ZVG7_9AGAR
MIFQSILIDSDITKNAGLLDDYEEHLDELADLLVESASDERINSGALCDCGAGPVIMQCHDCTEYRATCVECFKTKHLNNPLHWAEVWQTSDGFFVRHDISMLNHTIQLGHSGALCPSSTGSRKFTIVHHSGVHATRVAFCGCHENPPNKTRQLMRARLFPATMKETKSAFTFTVLKECHLHNLESKKASYNYMGALRRLTDNSFTADDPYSNFLRSIRFWDYLTMLKRLGQMHGIDRLLPHRPEGNLVLYCPACPEPGFNSEPNASSVKTPEFLRHLNQIQRTLDGNFQCNQYKKNSNPDDVSLCKGKAHFPVDRDYRAYLKENPGSTEKSTCNYLKAVNKQDKKKFKNMAITGTVNAQCSHVFILSSVDLHYGEKCVIELCET